MFDLPPHHVSVSTQLLFSSWNSDISDTNGATLDLGQGMLPFPLMRKVTSAYVDSSPVFPKAFGRSLPWTPPSSPPLWPPILCSPHLPSPHPFLPPGKKSVPAPLTRPTGVQASREVSFSPRGSVRGFLGGGKLGRPP